MKRDHSQTPEAIAPDRQLAHGGPGMVVDHRDSVRGDHQLSVVFPTDTDIVYKLMEEVLDIIKALHERASVLQNELSKIQQAIRALNGNIGVRKLGRKFRHTAATKRKLRLAQKRIWAAKRKTRK